MSIHGGYYPNKILIQSRCATVNEGGQPVDTWINVCEPWASIKGQTGSAAIKQSVIMGNIEASINSFSFRIRYRKGIDAGMRVVFDGLYFDIKQVIPDLERRECTYLVCTQGGNDG